MFYNHLAEIDEQGFSFDKIEDYEIIVFCCLPLSKELCSSVSLDSVRLLGRTDKRYYALTVTLENREKIKNLIEYNLNIKVMKGDFFAVVKANAFKKYPQKSAGIHIINVPVSIHSSDNSEIFFNSFQLLKKKIMMDDENKDFISISKTLLKSLARLI